MLLSNFSTNTAGSETGFRPQVVLVSLTVSRNVAIKWKPSCWDKRLKVKDLIPLQKMYYIHRVTASSCYFFQYFFKEVPKCLASQKAISTQHIYLTDPTKLSCPAGP